MTGDINLPFGEINVIILTDVHSWVAGHGRQEPELDADFGAILSFYQRLKEHCDEAGMDLFFVSNGDWAHGTGLTAPGENDASSNFLPILEKMPWDAINCGNHELYEPAKIEAMIRPGGFVDWFGDRYLTSNILTTMDDNHLGKSYKILEGTNTRLLTFGFLYNMGDPCDLVKVDLVQDVVRSSWFLDALKKETYNAILVLAHMDKDDPLVEIILEGLRDIVGPHFPVQFVTGHTHYRGKTEVDDFSNSFEAGRYLDTVGFVSFPTAGAIATRMEEMRPTDDLFEGIFLDANIKTLASTLTVQEENLWTGDGLALNAFIQATRSKLGLTEKIGCAPQDYIRDVHVDSPDSLYGLYRDKVVPKAFFALEDTESVMYVTTESFRYDLISYSELLVDDIWAICPFNDAIVTLGTFLGEDILKLNQTLNKNIDTGGGVEIPEYLLIGSLDDPKKKYKFFTHEFGSEKISAAILQIDPGASIETLPSTFTSTLIWMSFVMEEWPCNGLVGRLPDWFPTVISDQLNQHTKNGNSDKVLYTAIVAVVVIVLFGLFCCCHLSLRCIFGSHRSIPCEELEQFNKSPGSNRNGGSSFMDELSEDEHEML